MSLTNTNVSGQIPLYEIQVPKVAPNVEISNNASGTHTVGTSEATVVNAPNGSTALPSGLGADIWGLEVSSPIASDGSFPDVQIEVSVGTRELHTLILDGSMMRNLFPPRYTLMNGGYRAFVVLGRPMREYYRKMQAGKKVTNVPLGITGIKVPSGQPFIQRVKSTAGWGQTATAKAPLDVRWFGDIWTDAELGRFGALYASHGGFQTTVAPWGTVSGIHTIDAGPGLDAKTVGQLPGGLAQNGPSTINRKIIVAQNNATVATSGQFVWSNLPEVGGSQDNIADVYHDLGDNFTDGRSAFLWQEFGFRWDESLVGNGANPEIYVAFYVNSQVYPDYNDHGVLISAGRNPLQFGSVQPMLPDSGRYWPMPAVSRFVDVLSFKNNVVPVVSASGLSQSFAANDLYMLKGGTQIDFATAQ